MSVIADRVARMLDAALVAQGVSADDLAEAVTLLEAWGGVRVVPAYLADERVVSELRLPAASRPPTSPATGPSP